MGTVRTGVVISSGTSREFADLAVAAEQAGWDAIFTWEAVWGQDAWVTLTAAAMVTQRIRLGTLLTPLPRIRPWDLAGKVATLDALSGGRVQLAVGLGALHPGWLAFERDEGRRVRAEKLDEGLAVYDGLMRGQPFTFTGKHYQVQPTDFVPAPAPVQQPRVPVCVVGAYPSPSRCDGRPVGTGATDRGRHRTRRLIRSERSRRGSGGRCGRYGRERACPGTASTWSPRVSARPGRPATPSSATGPAPAPRSGLRRTGR